MGTSYVEYKQFGFWGRDRYLAEWIELMLSEIQELPRKEPWLDSLSEHWRIQAVVDGGCMEFSLDKFLADEAKKDLILSLAQKSQQRCSDESRRTGELFIALLRCQLKTIDSSPIEYL